MSQGVHVANVVTVMHHVAIETASRLQALAKRHLWTQFSSLGALVENGIPIMIRGDNCHVFDEAGRRYLDGTAGHFCVNAGHGRAELWQAAVEQMRELAYWSTWGYASRPAVELAARLADLAPGDLNRVFLTSGGSEAVESALKLARNFHRLRGEGGRTKVIARVNAYHGTSFGALSATGVPSARTQFEPLVPGARHVPNTQRSDVGSEVDALWAANAIEDQILFEGPGSVACVILEPVQNVGGCLEPPAGYFQRVREICDRYGVLLISDEVICGFGRLGYIFGGDRYGLKPDMIAIAKGMASGYAPVGALIASDRIAEPFITRDVSFAHGFTFGGHPAAAAVALANMEIFESDDLCRQVLDREQQFGAMLRALTDTGVVGDVRGAGYFWGIQLVKNADTPLAPDEANAFVDELRRRFHGAGLICRVDNRAGPVIQLAPPLTAGQPEFEEMERILREVLWAASRMGEGFTSSGPRH